MKWSARHEEHLIRHLNGEEPLPHPTPRWWVVLGLCTVGVLLFDLLIMIKL